MRRLTRDEFERLTSGAHVLSVDEHGERVLLTPDNRVIKLFRTRRWFSSARLQPYALRFARASYELARRGIVAAAVEDVARVAGIKRDLVVYRHMNGVPLRHALSEQANQPALLEELARMMADLHERGVYFRAAHFGNVLVQTRGRQRRLALIDLSATSFVRRPLSPQIRARNFRPLTRYAEDLAVAQAFGIERLIHRYLDAAQLHARVEARFMMALRRIHPVFASLSAP